VEHQIIDILFKRICVSFLSWSLLWNEHGTK